MLRFRLIFIITICSRRLTLGVGSSIIAALHHNRKALASEIDEHPDYVQHYTMNA